jgi:hypothetical protein
MNRIAIYASQFGAALRMLEQALETGHAQGLWQAPAPVAPFWQVGYHALFYTDLYLCPAEADFRPPTFHDPLYPRLGKSGGGGPVPAAPQLVDWCRTLKGQLPERLRASGFDGPSGFDWITAFGKQELHPYNLRHLQHHTGQLAERIRAAGGPPVAWVGLAPP